MIANIHAKTDKILEEVAAKFTGKHILLTDELRPAIIKTGQQLAQTEKMLEDAVEDVTSNRPNSEKKQKLLDLSAQVEEETRAAQEDAQRRLVDGDKDKEFEGIKGYLKILSIATTLLGGGAETLSKDAKRHLAERITNLTASLLDILLREFPNQIFVELRKTMKMEDRVRSIFGLKGDDTIELRHVNLIDTVIDAYEFVFMGYPVRALFGHLGNVACQPVLRISIAAVKPGDMIADLVARIWEAEIDAGRGRKALVESISRLPPVNFLHLELSSHLLNRVFWDQWDTQNRLALLDAVAESLKKIGKGLNKDRLARQVKSGSKGERKEKDGLGEPGLGES